MGFSWSLQQILVLHWGNTELGSMLPCLTAAHIRQRLVIAYMGLYRFDRHGRVSMVAGWEALQGRSTVHRVRLNIMLG